MLRQNLRHPLTAIRRTRVLPARVRRWDAAAAHRINRWRAPASVDRASSTISRAANRGVLWFSIAALIAISGRPRAALRGVASLAAASAIANLVGKQLFGGSRPLLDAVPLTRRLARTPTSPSFPSGHTASAVAFTAGVALESPAIGAALSPLAAAVAYSRVHTGAHWPSDVVGGAVIGLAVAGAGRVAVPARQAPRPPRTTDVAPVAELPRVHDGASVFVIINPNSGGAGSAPRVLDVLERRLPAARVHELVDGETVADVVAGALARADRPGILAVSGGDGTVAQVAHAARMADLPLLVIPGGTLNHFAGALHITDAECAITAAVEGTGRVVDVAVLGVGGREPITVLNTASVGAYPAFVADREQAQSHWGKPIASTVSAFRTLSRGSPIDVELDGRAITAWTVFIGVDRYRSAGAAPLSRDRLDDGILDVRVLRADHRPRTTGTLALALGTAANSLLRPSLGRQVVLSRRTASLELTVRGSDGANAEYAHDGEVEEFPADSRTLRLRLLRGALRVYAPVAE